MFNKRSGVFYRRVALYPDKTRPASLLNDFKNIPGKVCLNGVYNNDAFVNVENQHRKKRLHMKLLFKKMKSHTFQKFSSLQTTLTEEDAASCSRAFRKPQNAKDERKLIENGTAKSTIPLITYSLKKFFWDGPIRIHNWQVLSATLGHCYSQYQHCVTELLAD